MITRPIYFRIPIILIAVILAAAQCASGRRLSEMMTEGDALYAAGRYEEALVAFTGTLEASPKNRVAKQKQADSRARLNEWAAAVALEARRAESGDYPAIASVLYNKASMITGETNLRSKARELRNRIRGLYAFRVDFIPKHPQHSSFDEMQFNERFKRSIGNLPGQLSAAIIRDSAAPHVIFTIEIGKPVVGRNQETTNRSKRYVSGTSETPNERYGALQVSLEQEKKAHAESKWEEDKWQKEVSYYYSKSLQTGSDGKKNPFIEEKLNEARRNLGYTQQKRNTMQNNINSLGSQLAYTPKTLRVNTYSDYAYTETNHKVFGTMPLRISALRNSIHYQYFNHTVTVQHSDLTHPAHPVADIYEDPLVLPDEWSLKDELISLSFSSAINAVHNEFIVYHRDMKEQALRESSPEKKTESLIRCAIILPREYREHEWNEISGILSAKVGVGGKLGAEILE